MSDGQLVPVGTVGAVHLLVDRAPTAAATDWILTPSLPELRRSLATSLRQRMADTDAVRLLLPAVGSVSARMRLEALYAAVQDVAKQDRSAPFLVELVPRAGEAGAAVDVLVSLTQVRVASTAADQDDKDRRVRLPSDAESVALGLTSGRAVSTLSGAAASSATMAWLGTGPLAAGGAAIGGALPALGGPGLGLLGLAAPIGVAGIGAGLGDLFGRKKREKELEDKRRRAERDWRKRVAAAERAIEERHRQEVEALQARISELEATVAEQALAYSELSGRTGVVRPGPELAQPVSFALSLAADPVEPLQKRENLKYAWRLLVRYLGALMLADLERSGRCTPEAAAALQTALKGKSGEGRWLRMCTVIAELTAKGGSFFGVPLSAWRRNKKGYGTLMAPLARVKELRNDEAHGARIPTPSAAERWLSVARPHWEKALELARPYTTCRLFIVERVIRLNDAGGALYLVRWLVGDQLYPRAERCDWPVRLDPGRLCVLRPGIAHPTSADDVLDVSTFLRWEHSSVLDRPETYGVVGLGDNALQFGAFRFQDEKALGGAVPEWLAAK